jgi:hypothetical protein
MSGTRRVMPTSPGLTIHEDCEVVVELAIVEVKLAIGKGSIFLRRIGRRKR